MSSKYNTPERKAAFLKMRKKQILEGRQRTLLKTIEAIKTNDITKIELSSRAGQFYKEQIIDFYGQEAYNNELNRRAELRKIEVKKVNHNRSKKHLDKPYYPVPAELSRNTWNIRKKRIAEIGLEAYREEQRAKKKEYARLYVLQNKDKRKEYNKKNKHLAKEWSRRFREKNRERIKEEAKFKYELDENFRKQVKKNNFRNLKKNIEYKKIKSEEISKQKKEKIMNGTFFNEEAKKKRISRINKNPTKKEITALDFLKKKSYDDTLEVFSRIELLLKDSFIVDLKKNSIYSLDSKCFYGIYLNNNTFDLLMKNEDGYTFGIVGKNIITKSVEKRTIIKKISFQNWEDTENFIKILLKGY